MVDIINNILIAGSIILGIVLIYLMLFMPGIGHCWDCDCDKCNTKTFKKVG